MIDLGTWLDLLGTGIKTYGLISGGADQDAAYQAQAGASLAEARRALLQANETRDSAALSAIVTRRVGADVQSAARAAYGASGVDVNYGTARDVQTFIGQTSEEDALTNILLGERQARRLEDVASASVAEAGQFGRAGRNARSNSGWTAVGSLVSGGADAWSKWRSGNPTSQPAAPIETRP